MFSKTQWLLGLTAILASSAVACAGTETRVVVSGVTPVQCVGATLHSADDAARYAGCEAVSGDLRVVGSELSDLTALERIRSVSGTFEISANPQLDSLSGLERLSRVSRLVIRDNPQLTTLRGLEGVARAHQVLIENNGLYDVHGLSGLRQVGELALIGNPKLHNMAGLRNLSQALSVRLQDNPRLCARFGLLPALADVDRVVVRSNRGLSAHDVEALLERRSPSAERQAALR